MRVVHSRNGDGRSVHGGVPVAVVGVVSRREDDEAAIAHRPPICMRVEVVDGLELGLRAHSGTGVAPRVG